MPTIGIAAPAASTRTPGIITSSCSWPFIRRGFFWSEGLIAVLAVVGAAASVGGVRCGLTAAQQTLGRFLSCYTLILIVLYAAIPYKTPWCVLSLLDGMILLAGLGAWAIVPRGQFRRGCPARCGNSACVGWPAYWCSPASSILAGNATS